MCVFPPQHPDPPLWATARFAGRIEDISVPLVLVGLHGQLQDEVQDLGLSQSVKHIPLVLRVEYTVISNFIC